LWSSAAHRHGGSFIEKLKAAGIPIFQSFRQCARALRALEGWGTFRPVAKPRGDASVPILPDWKGNMTEYDAKVFLSRYGIPITRERLCKNLEEACDAAEELGFPVALKGMAASVLHKTEAGIVALDVRSFEELRGALKTVRKNLEEHAGEGGVQGFLVSEMVRGGFECIVGVKRDPVFGPMIAVGLGGIYVEVLSDVSLRHGAVDEEEALDMIRQLKGYSFLSGTRGSKPRDIRALASIVSRVSRLATIETDLLELDINPVFVLEEGKGAVAGTTMGGLSEKSDEYWVMVSGGGMVSPREDNNSAGGNRRRIVWSADIGGDEWKVRGGAVMTRDSDGRVTARSIDRGEELWVLDTPGEMRWERGSGEPM